MKIRVIRILEYEYEDEKAYMEDRRRWTHGTWQKHMTMKSAVLSPDFLSTWGTDLEPEQPSPGDEEET